MALREIEGKPVERYFGRVTGTVDVDDVHADDVVMAVVIVKVGDPGYKTVRGACVGTYPLAVQDMAIIDDEVMRKQLFYHLPHLQPPDVSLTAWHDGHAVEKIIAAPSTVSTDDTYVELPDTVVAVETLPVDDVLLHDSEDGEVFSPADESPERGRLGRARDPILQRFLSGD